MSDANSGNKQDSQRESKPDSIMTRVGIEEVKFMRTVKAGNYTPSINEIDQLLIDGKIDFNEARILFLIKSKTISFRNTEIRYKRRDIQERLSMNKRMVAEAIKRLVEKSYLIEHPDKDNFYFYALNPYTFDGLIILRSESEAPYRLNRNLKSINFLNSVKPGSQKDPKSGSQKYPEWILKVSTAAPKSIHETELQSRNHSAFETLKYILLKYIYLNGFSEARGHKILEIVGEIKNPEFLIKQFVCLIQSEPKYGRAITDEMLRAWTARTDGFGKHLRTNALAYIVTCWSELRIHFQNVQHPTFDASEEITEQRKQLADLIAEYPIEMNQPAPVIPMKAGER